MNSVLYDTPFRYSIILILILLLLLAAMPAQAQEDGQQPPQPPYPANMRVVVGSGSVLPRNTPSLNGTCGTDNHMCGNADIVLPNTPGVILTDAPVLDPAGWYWQRIMFGTGITGWATLTSTQRIAPLIPPEMVPGSTFQVVGNYRGPVLTNAFCISDGITTPAIRQMTPTDGGQEGTLRCAWNKAAIGNHIQVIQAVNGTLTASSMEFQFRVTNAPTPLVPNVPDALKIVNPASTPVTRVPPEDRSNDEPNLPSIAKPESAAKPESKSESSKKEK